jgi:hypothetical protein
MGEKYFLVPCTIKPGGFSSERTFEVKNGREGHLIGVASAEHLLDEFRKPLADDVPGYGQEMPGFVKCMLIRSDEEQGVALVELPSDDVVRVSETTLLKA